MLLVDGSKPALKSRILASVRHYIRRYRQAAMDWRTKQTLRVPVAHCKPAGNAGI